MEKSCCEVKCAKPKQTVSLNMFVELKTHTFIGKLTDSLSPGFTKDIGATNWRFSSNFIRRNREERKSIQNTDIQRVFSSQHQSSRAPVYSRTTHYVFIERFWSFRIYNRERKSFLVCGKTRCYSELQKERVKTLRQQDSRRTAIYAGNNKT